VEVKVFQLVSLLYTSVPPLAMLYAKAPAPNVEAEDEVESVSTCELAVPIDMEIRSRT
jgi:hypothetical protein